MRKIAAAVAVATALVTSQAYAEPTRGFTLESAKTAADKSFSVDMVNTVSGINQIRFGAFDGEVIINPNGAITRTFFGDTKNTSSLDNANFLALAEAIFGRTTVPLLGGTNAGTNPSIGYKRTINDVFAAFGMLGLNTQDGAKNEFLIGGAFSTKAEKIALNANATLGSENDDMVFSVGGGAYIPLEASGAMSQFQVGGELYISNRKNSNVGFGIGGRWAPRDNVTIDLLLLQDSESKSADAFLATPASVRVNLAF